MNDGVDALEIPLPPKVSRARKIWRSAWPKLLAVVIFCVIMLLLIEVPLAGFYVRPEATRRQVKRFTDWVSGNARTIVARIALVIGALAAYIGYKFVARQRFLRELRIARITADELKQKLDAGEQITIVDLRHSMDFEAEPEVIPGALHIEAKELQENNHRLPRDGEVVLYCT